MKILTKEEHRKVIVDDPTLMKTIEEVHAHERLYLGGSFCTFPTFTLQPFFITSRPRTTVDLLNVLQENEYAYFSRMSEMSRQEVIAEMAYQMH